MSPRASASSAAPICRTAIPPNRAPRSSIASIRSSSASASARPPSAIAQRTSSARSWTTSSVAPSRCITGSAARACSRGRRGVAEVHRQVARGGCGASPPSTGPSSSRTERQRALGRLDGARGVADVLAHVAEPLARGQRDVAVGIAARAARAALGTRRGSAGSYCEQHRDHPGEPRVAGARPQPRQQLPDAARCARRPSTIALHQRHHQRGARGVLELRRRLPVARPRRRPRPSGRSGERARRGSSRRARARRAARRGRRGRRRRARRAARRRG